MIDIMGTSGVISTTNFIAGRSESMTSPSQQYREIPLTQGYVALIDAEDYDLVAGYSWHIDLRPNGLCYAAATLTIDGKCRTIRMHQVIMPNVPDEVDHEDNDGLNNRRCNLRPANSEQNKANRRKRINSASPYKWVTFQKRLTTRPWQARVIGKHLGYFPTAEEAAAVCDSYAKSIHPDFVRLNGVEAHITPNHRYKVTSRWFEPNPTPGHPEGRILKYTLACGCTHQLSACKSEKLGNESRCKTCRGEA